jgi:drug/metabolite transporter (DMT)-like permease
MALCGAVAQILLTMSLRFGSAAVILLMDYTALIWASWYGFKIFDRAPPASLWLGAPLIVAAGLIIAYRERNLALLKEGSGLAAQTARERGML